MKKIFLASSSPRRRELLKLCGYDFVSISADIDESIHPEANLRQEIVRISAEKAGKILAMHPEGIVIGSDTVVALEGQVMGKPHSTEEAAEMLMRLSGRTHDVVTGLAIFSNERRYTDVSVSRVTFGEVSRDEIMEYVAGGEPMDKAGAYAVQGQAARFISRIDGDYYAIMGLPVHKVWMEMKKYGY